MVQETVTTCPKCGERAKPLYHWSNGAHQCVLACTEMCARALLEVPDNAPPLYNTGLQYASLRKLLQILKISL